MPPLPEAEIVAPPVPAVTAPPVPTLVLEDAPPVPEEPVRPRPLESKAQAASEAVAKHPAAKSARARRLTRPARPRAGGGVMRPGPRIHEAQGNTSRAAHASQRTLNASMSGSARTRWRVR